MGQHLSGWSWSTACECWWCSASSAALRAVAHSNTWLWIFHSLQVISFNLSVVATVKPTAVPPALKESVCSSVSLLRSAGCLIIPLLEDTEGHKPLNSSVVHSLETNQEKAQNNNPYPPSWFIFIFAPYFSLGFESLRKGSSSIKSMFH